MSEREKCFRICLYVADLILSIGLIAIGVYRFGTRSIDTPRTLFLNVYCIFFGLVILLFILFREKIYPLFNLISYPLGRAFFYLFLAALNLDVTDVGRFILCLVLIFGAIAYTVYFVMFYSSDYEVGSVDPKSAFSKKDLDGQKKDPEGQKGPSNQEKEKNDSALQRRT